MAAVPAGPGSQAVVLRSILCKLWTNAGVKNLAPKPEGEAHYSHHAHCGPRCLNGGSAIWKEGVCSKAQRKEQEGPGEGQGPLQGTWEPGPECPPRRVA